MTRSHPSEVLEPHGPREAAPGGVALLRCEPPLFDQAVEAPAGSRGAPGRAGPGPPRPPWSRIPAWATTWAMPPPMSPHPTTPTFEIVIRPPSAVRDRPTGARRCRGRAAPRAGCRGLRAVPHPGPHPVPWCIPPLSIVWRRVRCSGVSTALPCSTARSRAIRRSARSCATSRTLASTFARSRGSCSSSPARSSSAIRMSASRRIASRVNSAAERLQPARPAPGSARARLRWCSMIVMSGRVGGLRRGIRPAAHRARCAAPLRICWASSAPKLPRRAASWSTSRPASSKVAGGRARPGGQRRRRPSSRSREREHHRSHASLLAFPPRRPITRR